jgi:predicted secreted protein
MRGLRTPTGAVAKVWVVGWVMATSPMLGAIAAFPPIPSVSQQDQQARDQQASSEAPDSATFMAMPRLSGFSADGRYYLHLESSRDTGAGIPKSSVQLVEIATSRCVVGGCLATQLGEAQADWSLARTELALLQQVWPLRQAAGLSIAQAGTSLPSLSRSRDPQGAERWVFRLPGQELPTELRLWSLEPPKVRSPGFLEEPVEMVLELRHPGQKSGRQTLQFPITAQRASIREVRLAPTGDRLVVLLTTSQPTFEGVLSTTVVHGFSLETTPIPTIP